MARAAAGAPDGAADAAAGGRAGPRGRRRRAGRPRGPTPVARTRLTRLFFVFVICLTVAGRRPRRAELRRRPEEPADRRREGRAAPPRGRERRPGGAGHPAGRRLPHPPDRRAPARSRAGGTARLPDGPQDGRRERVRREALMPRASGGAGARGGTPRSARRGQARRGTQRRRRPTDASGCCASSPSPPSWLVGGRAIALASTSSDLQRIAAGQQQSTHTLPGAPRHDLRPRRPRARRRRAAADGLRDAVPPRRTRQGGTPSLCRVLQIRSREKRGRIAKALADEDSGFAYVARKVDPDKAARAVALDIPGVGSYAEEKRVYPAARASPRR